jgi:hypothetical protein
MTSGKGWTMTGGKLMPRASRCLQARPEAGGRRGKERVRAKRGSSDWRRGAAGSPDPYYFDPDPYLVTVRGASNVSLTGGKSLSNTPGVMM